MWLTAQKEWLLFCTLPLTMTKLLRLLSHNCATQLLTLGWQKQTDSSWIIQSVLCCPCVNGQPHPHYFTTPCCTLLVGTWWLRAYACRWVALATFCLCSMALNSNMIWTAEKQTTSVPSMNDGSSTHCCKNGTTPSVPTTKPTCTAKCSPKV